MGKKMLALRLRSSLVFFSPPNFFLQLAKKCPPDENNTQPTDKQKQKKQDTSRGHPGPEFPPEKENNTVHPLKAVTPLFSPPGSNYLFSSLAGSLFPVFRLFCRKAVFGEATGVAVTLPVRVPIMRSVGEKVFPPNSNLCWQASSRRQWFVPSPTSGDTAVRVFQTRTGRW